MKWWKLVSDRKTDALFKAGDMSELRKVILEMAEHPERAEEMGRDGRRYAETDLSLVKYYAREIYDKAIS